MPGSVASDIINQQRLLNAGASVLTVQVQLGHQHVDTTLRYAQVYDSTVATDYARAVHRAEGNLALPTGVTILSVGGQVQLVDGSVAMASSWSVGLNSGLSGQTPFI